MYAYRDKFGPSQEKGPLGPYLGNPALFKIPFDGAGCSFTIADASIGGNTFPVMLLTSGPNKAAIYDWPQLAKRNPAGHWAGASEQFTKVESINNKNLGISQDNSRWFDASWLDNYNIKSIDVWSSTNIGGDAFGQVGIWNKLEGIANPATHKDIARAHNVNLKVTFPDGRSINVIGVVNLKLRIAFITGFYGTVEVGDTWIPEAVRTLVNVVLIIVGVYTGNVALVVAAVMDIVVTWWTFAEELRLAEENANRMGKALVESGTGTGSGGGLVMNIGGSYQMLSSFKGEYPIRNQKESSGISPLWIVAAIAILAS